LALGLFLGTVLVCRNGLYQYVLSDPSYNARIEVIFKCSSSAPVPSLLGFDVCIVKYKELTMKCTLRYLINLCSTSSFAKGHSCTERLPHAVLYGERVANQSFPVERPFNASAFSIVSAFGPISISYERTSFAIPSS